MCEEVAFALFFRDAQEIGEGAISCRSKPFLSDQEKPAMNAFRITGHAVSTMAILVSTATYAITIDTVPVGNAGNAADTEVMNDGTTGYGSVPYTYRIGKNEVTNAEYTEFLNAVATSDTHSLYNTGMRSFGITQNGSSGSFRYTAISGGEDHPVVLVSFWDAARFANWLHNGQPTGDQELGTTEDGAYFLNGITNPVGTTISRAPNARWFIPSEDEWYKAAYHKNDGATGNYWDYPTASDTAPTAEAPPGTDLKNGSANYDGAVAGTTPVGAYTARPSDSAYGTFDQGGNVSELTEVQNGSSFNGLRGGNWEFGVGGGLAASIRFDVVAASAGSTFGFRVASIPEPSSLLLGTLATVGLLGRRRRWR